MRLREQSIISISSILTIVISLIIAVFIPLTYFIIAYEYIGRSVNNEMAFSARAVEGIIHHYPGSWPSEKTRLQKVLERRLGPADHNRRKIKDLQGRVIAESRETLARPVLTFSEPVFDSGKEMARIEIDYSILPLIGRTALVGACSSTAGMIIFLIYYFFPLRTVREAYGKLQKSERQYKLIAEKMTDIVWVVNMDLKVAYVSTSVQNVLGFTQEEIKNQALEEKLTPDSLSFGLEVLARELAIEEQGHGDPERAVTLVFEYYHKDGSIRWMETIISGLRDDHGVLTGLHGVSRDITERKQMEDALRTSEEKFASAFKNSPGAMCISSVREGRFVDVNDVFLNTLGYKREEVVGRTSADMNLWVNITERDAMLRELAETGKAVNLELQLRDKQGNIHWGLSAMSFIKIAGEPHILTQTMDITERKQMEEALRQSEERYRTILDEMDEGYEESDLQGNYTYVNDAFLRILGYGREEMIGTNYRQYSAEKESVREINDAYIEMYKTGLPIKRTLEWDIIRKDGIRRTCEFYASIRKDSNDLPIGFRGIGRDITDRKQAEAALQKSEESYTRLVNAIPDFIVRIDLAGQIIFVNDNTLRISGYRLDELQGRNILNFIASENHEKAIEDLLLVLDGGLGPKEYNLVAKDGREIPCEVNADVLRNENGQPFGIVNVCRDISERRRMEKLLKEQDERFINIAQHLPGVIYQFYAKDTGEYGINYMSTPVTEAAKIVSSIDPTKLDEIFPAILARIHHEDRERFLASIKTAVDTFSPWNFEGRMSYAGNVIWIQGLSVPKRYEDQTVFDGILLNVTERKLAEEKSRESEEKFREIFMTTPDCISISRISDGTILDVNRGFEDITGWKREEVIGVRSTEASYNFWVNPSERQFIVAELKAGREVLHREFEFRRKDGSVRTGFYSARLIKIGEEECIIFILQDITERKLAEEKFYKIFMTTPNCVAITRAIDGTIIDVNNGFEEIVGWKREVAIGTKSSEPPLNFWVNISDRDFMVAELKAGREVINRQMEFRRSDGSARSGIYSARPINIEGEECLIFILQDISEQQRMERELVESHKMKIMSQIASGVAHEVRNPLHAIQAISEAMAIDMDKKSDYQDYLMHIKAQVGRLSHLMNDLLDLGKPIQPSQFAKASLMEVATAALRYWKDAHPKLSQQLKVVNKLSPDDLVLIDANKIQQVIINLMDNAVQHSPRDEEILLELGKVSRNYLMVKVMDKGEGISALDQQRIFEPFFTTRKSGTGLGLSLCKHIVESHNGTIEIVNNEKTPGCTARFTLPVYRSKENK